MASIIKTDNIQKVSDDSNIIKKCGSTITIGSCGASVALACGATQTGFGRTGTVDWCTTAKTSPFTAVSGDGFFVNTTSGAVTVTLPASPSAGDIIALKDYANTWDSNNVTLANNSSKINGVCGNVILNTEDQSITLIYVDSTRGWRTVQDSTSDVTGSAFITATGGTITTSGDYKIHTFTSDGTFTVTAGGGALAKADYLVVAGGGGGGSNHGGGGGAGGYRESHCASFSGPYTASPLASSTSLQLIQQAYPITVGGGGAGGVACGGEGVKGSDSTFDTITSAGGGKGAVESGNRCGMNGGSGGGGTYPNAPVNLRPAGSGNTPPVSPPQGQDGGNGIAYAPGASGGGGGASEAGVTGVPGTAGRGGAGTPTSITASAVSYAGGGGGAATSYGVSQGAASPCGTGGAGSSGPGDAGDAGTTNRGGGGGGGYAAPGTNGGAGGSGIVILRYKFQ